MEYRVFLFVNNALALNIFKGEITLILVTKEQFKELGEAGLLDATRGSKNYYITSHKKKSRRHKYYVVEDRKILNFLRGKKPNSTKNKDDNTKRK